jgi:CDK inhibitor PHO81
MLLQLIKKLSATPTLLAQNDARGPLSVVDSQAALQANKATFFFQLVSPQCDFKEPGSHANQ